MKKKFQIFLMILALGLFVLPKQNFFAMNSMDCCNTEQSDSSSCHSQEKQDSDCSKNHSKQNNGCHSNCCTNCGTCTVFVSSILKPEISKTEINKISLAKVSVYNYSDPFITTALQEIWQPPKIG